MKGLPEFLASQGWEVIVVASFKDLFVSHSMQNVKYIDIPMAREPSLIQDIKAFWKWGKVLRKEKPDVIFTGTPKAGLIGILSSYFARVPIRIYHLRGLRYETTTGLKRIFFKFIEKFNMHYSTSIVCVSPSLMNVVLENHLAPSKKLKIIGLGSSNGINLNRFQQTNEVINQSKALAESIGIDQYIPVVGFVGRINKDKGIFDLLKAHEILTQEGLRHQLLIVGPKEFSESTLQKQIEALNLEDIHFTGLINNPVIAYQLMNIFCLPTYREGFPNVVLEAGLVGLPTITTEATGAKDSVISNKTGLKYPAGDIDALCISLRQLLTNKLLAKQMGQNAREYVSTNFKQETIWKLTNEYLKLELKNFLN